MGFLEWLEAIGRDADPAKPGFQAQGMYLLVCVTGPILFGALVASTSWADGHRTGVRNQALVQGWTLTWVALLARRPTRSGRVVPGFASAQDMAAKGALSAAHGLAARLTRRPLLGRTAVGKRLTRATGFSPPLRPGFR